MREIISLNIGSSGINISNEFYKQYHQNTQPKDENNKQG